MTTAPAVPGFGVPEMRFDGYYRIGRLFLLMEDLTCEFLRYVFSLLGLGKCPKYGMPYLGDLFKK